MSKELTARTVITELRGMASTIIVDNGGYRERLLAIADLLERLWYPMITMKEPITIIPPAWPRDEVIKQQDALIQSLQEDIALLRRQLHIERMTSLYAGKEKLMEQMSYEELKSSAVDTIYQMLDITKGRIDATAIARLGYFFAVLEEHENRTP